MKIEVVTFGKTIGMPNYGNDRPGVERAVLEDGETMESALTELNQRIIEWHKKEYPHLYPAESFVGHKTTHPNEYLAPEIIQIDKEFDNLHKLLNDITYKEDALALISKTTFKFHAELNAIAKSKPSKRI